MPKEKLSKEEKRQKKEKELLDFITQLKQKAKTTRADEIINKLIDKTPADSESESLKCNFTDVFHDALNEIGSKGIKDFTKKLKVDQWGDYYLYLNKCMCMIVTQHKQYNANLLNTAMTTLQEISGFYGLMSALTAKDTF